MAPDLSFVIFRLYIPFFPRQWNPPLAAENRGGVEIVLFGLVVDVVASRCQRLTDLTVTNEFALLKGNDAVEVGIVPVSEVEDNFNGIL
jgi:hypothetical protein